MRMCRLRGAGAQWGVQRAGCALVVGNRHPAGYLLSGEYSRF